MKLYCNRTMKVFSAMAILCVAGAVGAQTDAAPVETLNPISVMEDATAAIPGYEGGLSSSLLAGLFANEPLSNSDSDSSQRPQASSPSGGSFGGGSSAGRAATSGGGTAAPTSP